MNKLDPKASKLIACATVIEEMLPFLPPQLNHEVLAFGLHSNPDKLRHALQNAIDSSARDIETIFLGYGLCAQAAVGLKSGNRTIIVPRVDDCITIFLGSTDQYHQQQRQEPGTLYLTKGWIEAGSPWDGDKSLVKRFGEEKAGILIKKMLQNYRRLVFINTGNYELEQYRTRSQEMADRLNLRYEEIMGSSSIVQKLLTGPWDDDFVVAPPGHTIAFPDFRKS
jgi:hypothetical protein